MKVFQTQAVREAIRQADLIKSQRNHSKVFKRLLVFFCLTSQMAVGARFRGTIVYVSKVLLQKVNIYHTLFIPQNKTLQQQRHCQAAVKSLQSS